jgi:hypothetical protein
MTKKTADPKSAIITLRAAGATLSLLATRKPDGSAVTTVTTRDAEKKLSRGMTESQTRRRRRDCWMGWYMMWRP